MDAAETYDELAEHYHLIFEDWDRSDAGRRRIVFQIWDWLDDLRYVFHLYISRELASAWQTLHTSGVYRALRRDALVAALRQAGFKNSRWIEPQESGFYQPVMLAEAG
jgi:hypothetical protein